MPNEDLEALKVYRGERRRAKVINTILELCYKAGVTLVDLEEAAKTHVARHDEVAEGIKANRHKVMRHHRAQHAVNTRWEQARKFLTSHIDRRAKIAQTFGKGVDIDLSGEIKSPDVPPIVYKEGV